MTKFKRVEGYTRYVSNLTRYMENYTIQRMEVLNMASQRKASRDGSCLARNNMENY